MWRLFPIVGEIVDNKASILFEPSDKSSQVSYRIHKKIHKVPIEPSGPTRTVIQFKKSGTYIIQWMINNCLSYQHCIKNEEINKLIFVSCDFLEADTKNSLWAKMVDELSDNIGLIHLGDQAYMDPVFNQCKKLLITNNLNTQQQCFNLYGQRYCDTWNPHANILSNTSSYYIWDDHEIYNDIKLNDNHDKMTETIINVAVDAYKKYQQSFHVYHDTIINDYCWYKYINKHTILLTIERTSRDVAFEEIVEAILSLNMKKLILCFTSAPIPIPQGIHGHLYKSLKGLDKFWPEDKLIALYDWLFKWMIDDRQVVVVGGDIHFGVYGNMTKNELKIPVIIASPITNQPYPDRILAAKGMKGSHRLGDMTFTTVTSKARRCYATLMLDDVSINMVYCKDKYPQNKIKYLKALLTF